MTQTAAGSTIGFQLQNVSIAAGYTAEKQTYVAANFKGLATIRSSISPIVDVQASPFELTSSLHPTDTFYKASEMGAGQMVFVPRLKDTFPTLLFGAMGDCTNATAVATDTGLATTKITIKFPDGTGTFDPTGIDTTVIPKDYIPWLTFISVLPDNDFGALVEDAVIPSVQINIPQTGPLNVTMPFIGKKASLNDGLTNGSFTVATPDDFNNVPMSGNGTFKVNGVDVPVTGARVTIINSTTTPKEELVVGNYHPDTFATRRRAVTIEFTYKWEDGAMAQKILNAGSFANGLLDFDPIMPAASSFDAVFKSPERIVGSLFDATHEFNYQIALHADKVQWVPNGPIVPDLNGDDILMQNWVGTVVEGGANYFTATIQTDAATHAVGSSLKPALA